MDRTAYPMFESVKKQRVTEAIAEKILELINNGSLKPGDKLPSQKELVDMFGVSLPSVRESLVGLSMLGYVEPHAGQGYFVRVPPIHYELDFTKIAAEMSDDNIRSLYEARAVVEPEITGMAALRASEADVENLYRRVDEIEKSLPTEDAIEQGLYFHQLVADVAGNSFLAGIERSLIKQFEKYKSHVFVEQANYDRDVVLHRNIVDKIAARDYRAAKAAAFLHLVQFAEEIGITINHVPDSDK